MRKHRKPYFWGTPGSSIFEENHGRSIFEKILGALFVTKNPSEHNFEKNPGSPIFRLRGNDTGWVASTLTVTAHPGDFAGAATISRLRIQFHSL